jgi:hypothetical protein
MKLQESMTGFCSKRGYASGNLNQAMAELKKKDHGPHTTGPDTKNKYINV